MFGFWNRYRELVVVGVLLLHPLVSYLSHAPHGRELNGLDRFVLALSSPVSRSVTFLAGGMRGGWQGYLGLRGVREENQRLAAENAQLREKTLRLAEAGFENERLRKALGFAETAPARLLPASVIGINPIANVLSLRIDRGLSEGVRKGMAVATHDGVVGKVTQATRGYADVLLFDDVNSAVAVRVQRSRSRAIVRGEGFGKPTCKLEFALRADDIEEGDLLITSGTDGVFPRGLPVGKVTEIEKERYGLFLKAKVIPAVDPYLLEEVLVLAGQEAGAADLRPELGKVLP